MVEPIARNEEESQFQMKPENEVRSKRKKKKKRKDTATEPCVSGSFFRATPRIELRPMRAAPLVKSI